MKVTMLLADAAQAVEGKLYILGGGWSITGPDPTPMAIALKIEVPWNDSNTPHHLHLVLCDEDGRPVRVPTPTGEQPLRPDSRFVWRCSIVSGTILAEGASGDHDIQ